MDLSSIVPVFTRVVGHTQVPVRYADVTLEIGPSSRPVRWLATVGFAPTSRWLFGHFGGLEYFFFALDVHNEQFVLAPHEHLPAAL